RNLLYMVVVQLDDLGEFSQLFHQLARRGHQTSKSHKGPHNLDIDMSGHGGAKDAAEHRHAMFGKRPKIASRNPAAIRYTQCHAVIAAGSLATCSISLSVFPDACATPARWSKADIRHLTPETRHLTCCPLVSASEKFDISLRAAASKWFRPSTL